MERVITGKGGNIFLDRQIPNPSVR